MRILDFYKDYPDELSCKLKFKEIRDREGITCKKCGGSAHYWKKDKWCYECKKCKFRTSLRSGTVMQSSKLSFQYWFIAMHLVTSTKKSFSAKEMQRQLGHKRYDWIELDEGFFETVNIHRNKEEKTKRGRGSQKQTKVLVMVESEPNDKNDNPHRPNKKVGYLKMKVIENLESQTLNQEIEKHIKEGTNSVSDDYSSYKKITSKINNKPRKVTKKNVNTILPWVHKAISNAKRLFLDVHHRIDDDFLQNYLNEFCYKFNRRYFGDKTMERLIIAAVNHQWNEL